MTTDYYNQVSAVGRNVSKCRGGSLLSCVTYFFDVYH